MTDLKQIADLVTKMRRHEEEAERLLAESKKASANARAIAEEFLPDLMNEIGVTEFKTGDGKTISIKPIIRASLPSVAAANRSRDPERREELLGRFKEGVAYLRNVGAGSIVRSRLIADLGQDGADASIVDLAKKELNDLGIAAEVIPEVNSQSLTAWVRERYEHGEKVDESLFSVYTGQKAIIR